ncbi:MAG: 6-bladed beta-propeller [Gemmatimonadetes bacterium]|nr:6-bladed beta-propeller [Gemmatimonadota bacterium]
MGTHKIAAMATPLVVLALPFPTISNETIVGASDECEFTGGLALTEEWRYAPTETSPSDHLIAVPSSVARHPEGGVYVVDVLGRAVLQLSLDGDFVRRIGRSGEGPGEFRSPMIVRATDQGIAVYDPWAGISFFDTAGSFQRIVRMQPFPSLSARDFSILENGNLVLAGAVPSSDHAMHVYSPDGEYLGGMGQLRTDLEEPVLRARYNNGFIAETGAGRLAYARRVPFEFMLFQDSELSARVMHPDILHDYVRDVATPLEGGGWKFEWRHPSLGGFTRLRDGCFLAAVSRLPESVEGRLPEREDFYTEFVFLSDQGSVLHRQTLSFYFLLMDVWRDPDDRMHLLGIGRDKATGLSVPIQYLAVGTPYEGPAPYRP